MRSWRRCGLSCCRHPDVSLSESRARQYTRPLELVSHGDADARQPAYSVSRCRRADRRGGRARLQSLPDQEATGRPADQSRPERAEGPEQVGGRSEVMTASNYKHSSILLSGFALAALATSAMAQQVSREQDIVDLRLGQRVPVAYGSRPAGQIKGVSRAPMPAAGGLPGPKCIPR